MTQTYMLRHVGCMLYVPECYMKMAILANPFGIVKMNIQLPRHRSLKSIMHLPFTLLNNGTKTDFIKFDAPTQRH